MGGPNHIDLDNPGDCKAYADLYEREHKEKVSLESQVRSVRETWVPPTVHDEAKREIHRLRADLARVREVNEQVASERNYFKAVAENMLSKPDPGHPSGNGKPWARAENGEVIFGLLEDGTDEESYDLEMAESMASSLWRAVREARSKDHVVLKVKATPDPRHRPEARNLCICCDCNGHEVVSGPEGTEGIGLCRVCKKTQAEIDADA